MAWCRRCDRFFASAHALAQHRRYSPYHHVCYECNRDFSTRLGLKEHWVQSPRHYYCQYCGNHFHDEYDFDEHFQSYHHYCNSCRRVFKNEHGLHEHYRHALDYRSANSFQMHLKSPAHMLKDVGCSFLGRTMAFVSKSALVFYNYEEVGRTNIATDSSRLLTSGNRDQIHDFPTNTSRNRRAFECVLCYSKFRVLVDLNRHLASPHHQSKIYRCPLNTGLYRHIENERCGVALGSAMDDLAVNLVKR
ncbi:hypothetical protein BJ138DRAFT_1132478 [Hygrophoropsis aurantiaca]|uniref:Uncharacterized protein n=1 Tax=Hygrophoropsis aurantiaca TaxID=72124 RepID=A0ACB8AQA1_9AGAM|nr:hypothetical protein BJ138DRAFT_1132478 [Hygrophoropsis aurantiaca]